MINIVAAVDSKRGLGKNNELLFKIPEDFARMKKLTIGHPIIMGRRTFESIGRVLPGRTNIIVTRDVEQFLSSHPEFISGSEMLKQVQHDNIAIVCKSLEEAIEVAKKSPGSEEIIIFGGGQIFTEAVEKDLVDLLHLTVVEGDYNADTFFPDYSEFDKVINEVSGQSGEYKFKFLDLEKS